MGSTERTTRRLKQSNFSSRHRNGVVFVVVGLLLVGILGFGGYEAGRNFGWWGEPNGVRLLKTDPLAQPDLLDYRLAHTEQQQVPGFLQKPTSPFVIHWFYADARSLEDMKQEAVRYEVDMTDPRNPQRRVVEMYRIDENGAMQPLISESETTGNEAAEEDTDTLLKELKAERAAEQAKYESGDGATRWIVFVVGSVLALGAVAGLVVVFLRRR